MGKNFFFTFLLCFTLLGTAPVEKAFAQTPNVVDRQDLFKRGYKSLAFFITESIHDEVFLKNLTPDENEMLMKIGALAQEVSTINWLQQNKAQRYKTKTGFMYAYTVVDNNVTQISTEIDRPIQIQFSDNQKIFTLNPDEPVRSAMTETSIEKDIFINLKKINDPATSLDLAGVAALLLHEFGHKLGLQKNQDALNSVATKLELFIRSQTKTIDLAGKKVNILFFDQYRFPRWAETIQFGKYNGPNALREEAPLTSLDGQGTYVWVEDEKKVTDLTADLFSDLTERNLIPFKGLPEYQFLKQTLILASRINIEPTSNGRLKVMMNAHVAQMILPFMKTGSLEPKQHQLMQKAFGQLSPWSDLVSGYEFTIDLNSLSFKKPVVTTPTYQLPQFKAQFLEKRVRGNKLEIFYRIPGDRRFIKIPHSEQKYFWPEITLQVNGQPLILKATKFYPENEEFKFVLNKFDAIADNDIKIVGMHFILTQENLAENNSNLISKLFLPSEVQIATPKTNVVKTNPPLLKSVQAWTGSTWVSLRQRTQIVPGMHLRLVFKSTEILRQLTIDQNYENVVYASEKSKERPKERLEEKVYFLSRPDRRKITFNEVDLRQTLRSDTLYVDFNIDKDIPSQFSAEASAETDHFFSEYTKGTQERAIDVKTKYDFFANDERVLNGLSFVTESGAANAIDLKNSLIFSKQPTAGRPMQNSLNLRNMRCESLFN